MATRATAAHSQSSQKNARRAKPEAEVTTGPGEKLSMLDAAFRVLNESGTAMSCPELIGILAGRRLWSSPNGKTPAATLHSALMREIEVKKETSRFRKTAPGRFTAAGDGPAPSAPGSATARKTGTKKRMTGTLINREGAEVTTTAT